MLFKGAYNMFIFNTVICCVLSISRILEAEWNPDISFNMFVLFSPGHGIPALLEAILKLLPLDMYVDSPVSTVQMIHSYWPLIC